MTCQRQVSILSYTHNVQRSLLRYNLPLSPAPSFSVSNVQTISKRKGGGGEANACPAIG